MAEPKDFDFSKIRDYIDTAGSLAGATGAAVGAAVQGYQDGRTGVQNGTYRPINDIEVGVSEDTKNGILILAGMIGVFVIIKKFF